MTMTIIKKDIYMDKKNLNLEKIGKLNMNFIFINDFIEYFNLDTIDFGFLVLGLIKSLLLVLLMLGTIAFYILVERNVIGSIQRRKGPNNVGAYGLLQSIADGFKLILKEAVIPRSGNRGLFIAAPMVTLFVGLGCWAVIPFGEGSFISNINLGVLYLFAFSAVGVYAIIMAGWASNSKYAFLGAVRSAAQMLSYEVGFGMCLLSIFLISGSLNLSVIVQKQQDSVWFFIPLFGLFLVFFICMLAETNRHPFDLPEAEAELVSGYNVEYSSLMFAYFFLGEYAAILNMSAFYAIAFFGGWDFPILPELAFLWFALKIWFFGFLFVLVRCVLPRYRYDQLISLGWKKLVPLTIGYVMFIASFLFFFQSGEVIDLSINMVK